MWWDVDEETEKEISKNAENFVDDIKSIKKVKDYGLSSTTIRESTIYPKVAKMRQDIWLSKDEKIEIKYIDEELRFQIVIMFEEEALIEALDITAIFMAHWGSELYVDKTKIYIQDKESHMMGFQQLSRKINKSGLGTTENHNNEEYLMINQNVWVNKRKALEVIKSIERINKISIDIEKIEGEENFWQHMSCIHISVNTKYYQDGYLEDLEWKRIDPYLIEDYENRNSKRK